MKEKNKRAREEWGERVSKVLSSPGPKPTLPASAQQSWAAASLAGSHVPGFLPRCQLLLSFPSRHPASTWPSSSTSFSDCHLRWVLGHSTPPVFSDSSSFGLPTALPPCPETAAIFKVHFPDWSRYLSYNWDCSRWIPPPSILSFQGQ